MEEQNYYSDERWTGFPLAGDRDQERLLKYSPLDYVGPILGPSNMIVLMHDRSGVLVTDVAMDIHLKLSFDPTMKLHDMPTGPPSHNTRLETHLTLQIITGGGVAWIATLEASSATDQRSPRGRRIYILEQSWRPLSDKTEAEFYEAAKGSKCDKIRKIILPEKVTTLSKADETGRLIRHSLENSHHKLPRNPHTLWPEQHDAVDDMESLFWVLFEFCLIRKGPSNVYREEYREEFTMNLDEDNGDDHNLKAIKCLRLVVDRIFNVNDNSKPLEHKKEHILEKPKILKIKSLFISTPISILSKVLC
ncbi:hypothetical protein BDN70DRAFT_921276 [Pholiota conissans]|uniref:Fungal-type protein kinase domain-containing protein n=1 Tax=Pholiota conissans TaxID=109636 RepID=A0A9P5Z0X4_9AGAR|nr:hypothetical protein BDN70DRAFT_921276 [Pholiota conissans]